MKKFFIFFLCVALLVFFSPTFYKLYYRFKEPKFLFPVLFPIDNQGRIPIRNDRFGNGEFGAKRKGGRIHKGIDVLAPMDTPVIAAKSGRAMIGQTLGIGKYVFILHPEGSATLYGHLSKIRVKQNQWVRQAQIIGNVGKTGNAATRGLKPHLHFEIRIDGQVVNPIDEDLQIK